MVGNRVDSLLVTGGAGFIGSAFVRHALANGARVVVLDAFTYAGHRANIEECLEGESCQVVEGNICNFELVKKLFDEFQFDGVAHFAAESHVDNSIQGPGAFVETNMKGTFTLLEVARNYWHSLAESKKGDFRFLHVSTDEVFGELGETGKFSETTPYQPRSPYSATKAASDHLVRAWHHTYGLPTIVTNCSNNYGPRQYPEKMIPRMIRCALQGEPLPVYGKGENIRDWIHVEDHCRGIWLALTQGKPGETYCFGGRSERKNIDIVKLICKMLDQMKPRKDGRSYEEQISFVTDRLGHDWRYAIDDAWAEKSLGFSRQYERFEKGLEETVKWYLDHPEWAETVLGGKQ